MMPLRGGACDGWTCDLQVVNGWEATDLTVNPEQFRRNLRQLERTNLGAQRWSLLRHHYGHLEADDAEVQVMMLADDAFEGDTVFELPGGGTVNVVRNGDEYEVEVAVEEMMEDVEKNVRVRREREQDGEVRVEKRVIVVKEEE